MGQDRIALNITIICKTLFTNRFSAGSFCSNREGILDAITQIKYRLRVDLHPIFIDTHRETKQSVEHRVNACGVRARLCRWSLKKG
ncbi:hypothetical protein [Woodsholea maritima]|uniref:hypothetical protein n=1 Tax=Woodsholea maritima TaxID=240237 RepID=UPI00035ED5F1|nr:hypothetical protein [Woodsholea maritima]